MSQKLYRRLKRVETSKLEGELVRLAGIVADARGSASNQSVRSSLRDYLRVARFLKVHRSLLRQEKPLWCTFRGGVILLGIILTLVLLYLAGSPLGRAEVYVEARTTGLRAVPQAPLSVKGPLAFGKLQITGAEVIEVNDEVLPFRETEGLVDITGRTLVALLEADSLSLLGIEAVDNSLRITMRGLGIRVQAQVDRGSDFELHGLEEASQNAGSAFDPGQGLVRVDVIAEGPASVSFEADRAGDVVMGLLSRALPCEDLAFVRVSDEGEQSGWAVSDGVLSFPGIDVDPVLLQKHERVTFRDNIGQLQSLEWTEEGLGVSWRGSATEVRAGRDDYSRDLVPSKLEGMFATRRRMYLIGILIYLGLFLAALARSESVDAATVMNPTDLL